MTDPNAEAPARQPRSPIAQPAAIAPSLSSRRLVQLGLLMIATLVAAWPISGLIAEREGRQAEMRRQFARDWGPQQTLRGPLLVVPYQTAADKPRHYLKIAPARMKADVKLAPEQRKRGLFQATVYTATTEMQGVFAVPGEAKLASMVGEAAKIHWADSFVMTEAKSLAGMTARDGFTWNGEDVPWRNCREVLSREGDCEAASAVLAQPKLANLAKPDATIPFRATLSLRGTSSIALTIDARETEIAMAAPWRTPSFIGTMLPATHGVTDKEFEARWQSLDQNKPLAWVASRAVGNTEETTSVGVDLLEATPTYRMINRVSKYNVLFVALAFTTYFLFELLSGVRIHVVQYGLLGVSLTLFGLLLLSLSEPLGYAAGYGISAALVLAQASLYTGAVTRRIMPAAIFAAMLTSLFGFLYVVLSLETYALLVGSLALFAVLSVVMALTQRVDWAAAGREG